MQESLHGPYGADKFAHFDTKNSVVIQFEFFRSSRRSVVTEQGSALAPFLPSYAQRLEIRDALHGKGHT